MEHRRKFQKRTVITGVLDLPEQIFRDIFQYLDFDTIFITIRKVCQKLKRYVDDYKKVVGVFMLMAQKPTMPRKLMFVLQQHNGIKIAWYKQISPFPYPIYTGWMSLGWASRDPLHIGLNPKVLICSSDYIIQPFKTYYNLSKPFHIIINFIVHI